jgi:hypothetical protein
MSSGIVARSAKREEEILRQLSDVFKELAHLSVDVTKGKLDDAHRKLDAQAAILSELSDTVNEQIDIGNESTELLGRLLQSARGRLDVLEGSRQNPA